MSCSSNLPVERRAGPIGGSRRAPPSPACARRAADRGRAATHSGRPFLSRLTVKIELIPFLSMNIDLPDAMWSSTTRFGATTPSFPHREGRSFFRRRRRCLLVPPGILQTSIIGSGRIISYRRNTAARRPRSEILSSCPKRSPSHAAVAGHESSLHAEGPPAAIASSRSRRRERWRYRYVKFPCGGSPPDPLSRRLFLMFKDSATARSDKSTSMFMVPTETTTLSSPTPGSPASIRLLR